MEIITGTQVELKDMIERAYMRLEKCENLVDKYALADYIRQLHDVENVMTGGNKCLDQIRCFGPYRKQKKYYDYIDQLFNKLDRNFIQYKSFHNELFDEILSINDENVAEFLESEYSGEFTAMPKEEFYELFFEFLKAYGLEDRFDRFISNKRIFSRPLTTEDRHYGECLHDPISHNSSLVFCGFQYDVRYLLSMSHEFGHAYDLSKIKGKTVGERNLHYSYASAYGEVMSMAFEKLFLDYLLKKKYRVEQVQDYGIDYAFACRQNVLSMYMLTLLDSKTIMTGPGLVSKEVLMRQMLPYFDELGHEEMAGFIEERNFDTWKDQAYAYGELLSTILKENIKEEGLDSKLMRGFMNERTKLFRPEFIVDNGFNPEAYQKVYVRDIDNLKR